MSDSDILGAYWNGQVIKGRTGQWEPQYDPTNKAPEISYKQQRRQRLEANILGKRDETDAALFALYYPDWLANNGNIGEQITLNISDITTIPEELHEKYNEIDYLVFKRATQEQQQKYECAYMATGYEIKSDSSIAGTGNLLLEYERQNDKGQWVNGWFCSSKADYLLVIPNADTFEAKVGTIKTCQQDQWNSWIKYRNENRLCGDHFLENAPIRFAIQFKLSELRAMNDKGIFDKYRIRPMAKGTTQTKCRLIPMGLLLEHKQELEIKIYPVPILNMGQLKVLYEIIMDQEQEIKFREKQLKQYTKTGKIPKYVLPRELFDYIPDDSELYQILRNEYIEMLNKVAVNMERRMEPLKLNGRVYFYMSENPFGDTSI